VLYSGGSKCDCSFLTYGMADIPAFIEEDYMTSLKKLSYQPYTLI
jgi:hypothetical protein